VRRADMRVISQDGTMDFSYEMSTIFIYGRIENAIAIQPVGDSEVSIVGRYSSKEKAIKAMEMLRETYIGMPIVMQNVDISDDMAKEFERLKKCGIMVRAENQPSKVEYINNTIFQFPQDEEIEV
jgi:hypothetical protein